MKTALIRMFAFGMATLLLSVAVVDSQAGILDRWRNDEGIKDPRIAAGLFTGKLSGEIKLNSKKFQVTPNTMIYVVGEGPQDDFGTHLTRRAVTIRGAEVNGVMVAQTIVVRPRNSYLTRTNSSQRMISNNNPNVGILEDQGE